MEGHITSAFSSQGNAVSPAPYFRPSSTDIVLLPVSSNSSGLLGPVRKASLHRAPQVPANGSPGRQWHVVVFRPMSDTHSCALSGGKVYSESMNVSIFKSLRLEKRSKATTLETMPSCTDTVPSSGETNRIHSQHCWPGRTNGISEIGPNTTTHKSTNVHTNMLAFFFKQKAIFSDSRGQILTLWWISVCRFNASHSSGLEPVPLCSYQSISFNRPCSHRTDTVLGLLSESCLSRKSHTRWQWMRPKDLWSLIRLYMPTDELGYHSEKRVKAWSTHHKTGSESSKGCLKYSMWLSKSNTAKISEIIRAKMIE